MFQALFITGYAIFSFWLPTENYVIDYVLLITTCTCQVSYFIFGIFLHKEHAWRLYKKVGSDNIFRSMYRIYLLWKAFFKLDLLYTLLCVVLSGRGVYNTGWLSVADWTMIGIEILIYFPLGYYSFKNEAVRYAIPWMLLSPISVTYICGMWSWQFLFNFTSEADWSSKVFGNLFSVTSGLAVIVHFILLVLSIKAIQNFGKGLKKFAYLKARQENQDKPEEQPVEYTGVADDDKTDDDDLSIYDVLRNTYVIGIN